MLRHQAFNNSSARWNIVVLLALLFPDPSGRPAALRGGGAATTVWLQVRPVLLIMRCALRLRPNPRPA